MQIENCKIIHEEGGTKQSNNRKGIPIGEADRVTHTVGMLAIGFVVALFKYTGPV